MVVDVHQMLRQIRIQLRQAADAHLFKLHIVRRGADVQGNVPAKLLRQGPPRIGVGIGQKLRMHQLAAFALDMVQRILERDLFIGPRVVV